VAIIESRQVEGHLLSALHPSNEPDTIHRVVKADEVRNQQGSATSPLIYSLDVRGPGREGP
jgi:hypothetical protein